MLLESIRLIYKRKTNFTIEKLVSDLQGAASTQYLMHDKVFIDCINDCINDIVTLVMIVGAFHKYW